MNHQDIDRRILTTCRLIARKIETDPEKKGLQKGLENIRKWRINNGHDSPCYQIWEDIILHESWNKIRRILVKDDEKGRQLRQFYPFAGVISQPERMKILRRFRKKHQEDTENLDEPV